MRKNKNSPTCWLMGIVQGVLLVAMAGCAQQPVTAAVSIPPIPAGEARIWFYRDYVINAFNKDLPYNQFIIEQLAGDQLPHPTQDRPALSARGSQTRP